MTAVPFEADEATRRRIIFYVLPQDLRLKNIDPLMRPIVQRINESGWVWTAESCQGHPDYDGSQQTGWDHNTDPFLRLVCATADFGKMLGLLARAMRLADVMNPDDRRMRTGYVCPLRIFMWPHDLGPWEQVNVYVDSRNVRARDFGIEALTAFAERLERRR